LPAVIVAERRRLKLTSTCTCPCGTITWSRNTCTFARRIIGLPSFTIKRWTSRACLSEFAKFSSKSSCSMPREFIRSETSRASGRFYLWKKIKIAKCFFLQFSRTSFHCARFWLASIIFRAMLLAAVFSPLFIHAAVSLRALRARENKAAR